MKCYLCKKEIIGWRSNKNKAFCNRGCYLKYHCVVHKNNCECCNKVFYPKYKKARFCSVRCCSTITGYQPGHKLSDESIDKMKKTKRINSKYKNITTVCKNCNKEFTFRQHANRMKMTYCSKECLHIMGGRRGHKLSEEMSKKMSIKYSGKNNPCWKGGNSKMRFPLYSGPLYRKWRTAVFERDNYTCHICLKRGGKLEAHHKIPWSINKDGWFDIDNGQTLCKECHKVITKDFMKKNWVNQYTM